MPITYLKDAALRRETALPAADANNNSEAIDLGQTAEFIGGKTIVRVAVPPLPALAGNLTFTIQDSEDGETFAAVPQLAAFVATAAGKADEQETLVRLPPSARRFIRVNQAVATGGGNNTAVKSVLELIF